MVENITGFPSIVSMYVIMRVVVTLVEVVSIITFSIELDIVVEIVFVNSLGVGGLVSVVINISETKPVVEPVSELNITLLIASAITVLTAAKIVSI